MVWHDVPAQALGSGLSSYLGATPAGFGSKILDEFDLIPRKYPQGLPGVRSSLEYIMRLCSPLVATKIHIREGREVLEYSGGKRSNGVKPEQDSKQCC